MSAATGSSLEHSIGADGLLALRLRNGHVRLNAVEGEAVRIRDRNGHDLADMFVIEAAAGSLSLKAIGRGLEIIIGPRNGRRGGHDHDPELEIDLPRRASLVLEAASSTVGAHGLRGDQRYRSASGDVALRAVGGRIAIEVVSGDVDINAIGAAEVTARSVSGDIQLRAATLSALQLATTSGDMRVAGRLAGPGPFTMETVSGDGLLAPAGDVRIEMTSVTGDLDSELEGPPVTERGRRSLAIGKAGPLVTFRSMSGDLRVVRPVPVTTPELPASSTPPASRPPDRPRTNGAIAPAYDAARLRILRALERGDIDVPEAGDRLERLDAGNGVTEPETPSGIQSNG